MNAAVSLAASKLGYSQLKPKQQEAIKKFISGRDVFVRLPTGGSKSLCYAVLPAISSPTQQLEIDGNCSESLNSPHEGSSYHFSEERAKCCVCLPVGRGRQFPAHVHDFQLMYMSPETSDALSIGGHLLT